LSQTIGTAVMRLADADLLPFEFTDFADTVRLYVKQLTRLADDGRGEAIERNQEIDEGVFSGINDPRRPRTAPPKQEVPPRLNFALIENASDRLALGAERYQVALDKAWPTGVPRPALEDLNQKLVESERRLAVEDGLLRRPWYKHMIYAPGVYSGYAAKTLPGVREAIEQKHWDEANSEIERAAKVLDGETTLINSAAQELEQLVR
jgi:N-acetylated-alpha-linked acidic dipeptidase